MNTEILQKINDVGSAFDLLLSAVNSVNESIMSLAPEELKKGNFEKAQEYNDKSKSLIKFTKDLLDHRNHWDNLFANNGEDNVINKKIAKSTPIVAQTLPVESVFIKKDGYVCKNQEIVMEFVSAGGGSYSLKLPIFVFIEIVKYIIKYFQNNEYIQSKDIAATLEQYLLKNTNYRDIKPIASKTLKFLLERGLLKYRNGRTGYYQLSGTADDVFAFLDTFDKRELTN
ncbi:hypothetical protein SDC9_05971 [bioreactor metagenome]|uniref:Uncharacterized protein n=1 Tax=bioreactor metagenome TaxID=1076179 RepID=A0A644T0D6_9ZZZZ|nr:hypothetical protein [Negativicutes bacterium]